MKKVYFTDQYVDYIRTMPTFVDFKTTCYTGHAIITDGFSLNPEEAELLKQILGVDSLEEISNRVITTVDKIIYGSLMEWPCTVAVGWNGLYVQYHNYDDSTFGRLYTQSQEIKILTEEELIQDLGEDYKIVRIPLHPRKEKQKVKTEQEEKN